MKRAPETLSWIKPVFSWQFRLLNSLYIIYNYISRQGLQSSSHALLGPECSLVFRCLPLYRYQYGKSKSVNYDSLAGSQLVCLGQGSGVMSDKVGGHRQGEVLPEVTARRRLRCPR